MMRNLDLFGIALASDFPFSGHLTEGDATPDLMFGFHPDLARPDTYQRSLCLYESPIRREDGDPAACLYRLPDHDILRFTGVADFHLWPDRIIGRPIAPGVEPLVEINLLGPVLSYWLEQRGIATLHASALALAGRALGFLSTQGGGKTGIAAALMQSGAALLSDDLLALAEEAGTFLARPGYPQMRMWPDEAACFLGRFEDLPLVHPDLTKRRVPVGPGGFGSFHDSALPLSCLYLLDRQMSREAPVEIHPISPRDALIELLRHSFTPLLVEAAGLQPARFDRLARLVRQVPVRRLRYPSGFDLLPHVAEAVRGDLERC